MSTNVRAKFKCSAVEGERVSLTAAVEGEANRSWSKWTPSGQIAMTITNPDAVEFFKPGREYLLTFEAAEPPAASVDEG
jgi:hypothetical protein